LFFSFLKRNGPQGVKNVSDFQAVAARVKRLRKKVHSSVSRLPPAAKAAINLRYLRHD
jgi:hypothetical protein